MSPAGYHGTGNRSASVIDPREAAGVAACRHRYGNVCPGLEPVDVEDAGGLAVYAGRHIREIDGIAGGDGREVRGRVPEDLAAVGVGVGGHGTGKWAGCG